MSHTRMFWLIRALLVTINNQSRSWSSIHRCSDWSGPYLSLSTINQSRSWSSIHRYFVWSGSYLSLSTINKDLDHPYTDVQTDQSLTCLYQQSNQDLDHPYTDFLSDQGLTCHYQQSIKIFIIHTHMFWLIRVLLVTINNQWRSWSSIHRCSDWSGPYLSLSTINQDLDHPYTDVLTDQGLTCHYQQSIKIFIIHTQMFWLIRVLLVTINNQ